MTSPLAIQARGLSKTFGLLTAVSDLHLDVPRGVIYGFLGPNGSGKSTTIRMLCGLLTPSAGEATVLGVSVPGNSEQLKPRIGYMTQRFSLFGDMTVRENLQFMAEIYSVARRDRAARINELLATYSLAEQNDQLAATMSGGQRQRLSLACAVLHQPELLLLDEPTSAVDPQSRRDFWSKLFALAEAGTTILVSTHYMDEAERCHRLAILDHGYKVADDTPDHLRANTGMHIVEVSAHNPYAAQAIIAGIPDVSSVTQLGMRLRVLLPQTVADPVEVIRQPLLAAGEAAELAQTQATLEDVFVAVTLPGARHAA